MLDASFLQAEDSDPHVSLAVGGVSIIEGPPPDYGDLVSAFAERAQGIPRCTQVLHTHPFDLGCTGMGGRPPLRHRHITFIASRCRIRGMTPSCSG